MYFKTILSGPIKSTDITDYPVLNQTFQVFLIGVFKILKYIGNIITDDFVGKDSPAVFES